MNPSTSHLLHQPFRLANRVVVFLISALVRRELFQFSRAMGSTESCCKCDKPEPRCAAPEMVLATPSPTLEQENDMEAKRGLNKRWE